MNNTVFKSLFLICMIVLYYIPLFGQEELQKEIPVNIIKDATVHIKATDFSEKIGQVKSGETYYLLKEENGCYQIKLNDGTIGWVKNWNARIPLVENDVRVTGRLMSEPNIRSEIIIELRMNASAMLLEDNGKWKKVRLADGREGWLTNVRTVTTSITYTQRGGWLYQSPSTQAGRIHWVDEEIPYVPKKRQDNWYFIALSDGSKGWMANPQLPAALVAKENITLSKTDDIRRFDGADLTKGAMVEPLDYFKDKYMVRTENGEVGFQMRGNFIIYEPETISIVQKTEVHAKKDKGSKVIGKINAMSSIPLLQRDGDWAKVDAGAGVQGWINLAQSADTGDGWMYVGFPGALLEDASYNADVIDSVKIGQKFKKESIYGQYYEVTMEDGREGWLRIHVVKPSPAEKSVMLWDANIVSDRKSQEGQNRIIGGVKKWDNVTELEREEKFVKIRTEDGKIGWVTQRTVRPEGQVSDGSFPLLYHLMWKFYKHNHSTKWFGEILYFIFFLLFMSVPYVIVYFLARTIGYVKFLPNFIVKVAGTAAIFFGAIILVHHTNWPSAYPPFEFYPNLTMAGHLIFGLATIMNFWHLIYRHRCKYCHTMFTVEITDVQHLGTVHHTTTTTYNDGSRSKSRSTTKNYLVTYHCVQCDKSWTMEESYSSGGHN